MTELDSVKTDSPALTPPIEVVHSTGIWLPQTMTWLDTQITRLPADIKNTIVCDYKENLDQFPYNNIVCAAEDNIIWQKLKSLSWKFNYWRRHQLLKKQLRQSSTPLLHSHFGDRGWENINSVTSTQSKHVVSFYGYDVGQLPKLDPAWHDRYQDLFRSADLFLCEGPCLGRSLVELGCPQEKVQVHHLAINLDKLPYVARTWQPNQTLRILLAGSFVEKKGMPYAIEAIGKIQSLANIEVTIIGDANPKQQRSVAEKELITEKIVHYGLTVNMLGYQPHQRMIDEAYQHHIFISPSVTASDGDTEGGAPVSIIEMAASGMPIVSTTHCDIPEVIPQDAGLLAPERDSDALAKHLTWLIENPQQWNTLTDNARNHIQAEFDPDVQAQRLAGHYHKLVCK